MRYPLSLVPAIILLTIVSISAQSGKTQASNYYQAGTTQLGKGDFPAAVRYFSKAVADDSNNSDYNLALGLAHYKAGNLEKALEYSTRAAKLRPADALALNQRGVLLYEMGRNPEACEALAAAAKLAPNESKIQLNAGRAYLVAKDFKQALPFLERARDLDPNNFYTRVYTGYSYSKRHEYKKAIAEFEAAIKQKADEPSVHYYLGSLYLVMNDKIAALRQQKIVESLDAELGRRFYREIYSDKVVDVADSQALLPKQ